MSPELPLNIRWRVVRLDTYPDPTQIPFLRSMKSIILRPGATSSSAAGLARWWILIAGLEPGSRLP